MGQIEFPDYVRRHCFYTREDWRELSNAERNNAKQRAQRREMDEDTYRDSRLSPARRYIAEIRKQGECEHCDEDRPAALQFHHRNPETKEFSVSGTERSLEATKKEVAKCRLLCASCHRVLHANGSL